MAAPGFQQREERRRDEQPTDEGKAPADVTARGAISAPTMPLIPAMRPFRSTSIAAAMPMRMPPASDGPGVKWLQSMAMVLLQYSMRIIVLVAASLLVPLLVPLLIPSAAAQSPEHPPAQLRRCRKVGARIDDPERDAWQKPHAVIEALALKPDAVVADLGAGTGYFSARLANMLPKGTVYAVDVEPEMVKYLGERAKREGLKNLKPVVASADDARLPVKVDLILLVDVYHHIENRDGYFRRLAASLKPGGRLAVIDFRLDSPEGPPKAARIAPEKVKAELSAAGYALQSEHGFLPRQYFLVFQPRPTR